jgi:hypothetical protein
VCDCPLQPPDADSPTVSLGENFHFAADLAHLIITTSCGIANFQAQFSRLPPKRVYSSLTMIQLITYTGFEEVLVTTSEQEPEMMREYFTEGGRELEDYDREVYEDFVHVRSCGLRTK